MAGTLVPMGDKAYVSARKCWALGGPDGPQMRGWTDAHDRNASFLQKNCKFKKVAAPLTVKTQPLKGQLISRRDVLTFGSVAGLALALEGTMPSLGQAHAQTQTQSSGGLALLVGTQRYQRARDLRTPVADAQAVANRLADHGLPLYGDAIHANPDRATYAQLFRDFAASVPEGGHAFVYLAGHGVAQGGVTHLIPSDDDSLTSREQLTTHAVPLPVLTARLAARRGVTSFVFVDACRANGLRGSGEAVGGGGDLVAPSDGSMTLMFAASPGQIAADGGAQDGALSPFAEALVNVLDAGPHPVAEALTRISTRTRSLSGGAQTPFHMQVVAEPAPTGLVP